MSKRKLIATVSIAIMVVVAVALSVFLRKPSNNERNTESTAVSTSTQATSALSEEESGDSFNTDDLDTGIAKEGRSTGGLAHGVDETEASTEAKAVGYSDALIHDCSVGPDWGTGSLGITTMMVDKDDTDL